MKKTVVAVSLAKIGLALVLSSGTAEAKSKTAKKTVDAKPKLSRNLSFSGSAVDGKYHSAGESIAQVEAEKSLSELMGIRKNFRDRLANEKAGLENGEGTTK